MPRRPTARILHNTLVTGLLATASPLAMGHALAQVVAKPGGPTTVTLGAGDGPTVVTTTRVTNGTGLNTFNQFDVVRDQTVKLMLPTNASSLVNVVRDRKVTIDGIVNSYKDGKIGGNVYFVAPQGFVVSATGKLNIGTLTVATPTADFADELVENFATNTDRVNSLGGLAKGATDQIEAPLSADGSIVIAAGAKINASGFVTLRSASIDVGAQAEIRAGQRGYDAFIGTVNATDIPEATAVVENAGRIKLVAENASVGEVWDRDASAGIDVAGKLYGDSITMTATATADASVTAESAETALADLPGLLAGISGSYVHTDARATINVRSTAVLDATGDVSLAASTTTSTASTLPDIAAGGALALTVAYAELDAHADVAVASGASIIAGNDLSLSALNTAALGASAFSIASPDGKTAGADVAAVGIGDIGSTVDVASGTILTITGKVAAHAQNDVTIGVDATAYAAGDSPAGMAVVYSKVTDTAKATFSADLGSAEARAGALNVSAFSNTTKNDVKASTDVGPTITNKVINLLPTPQGLIQGKLSTNQVDLPKLDGGLDDVQSTTDPDGKATGSNNVKSAGRFGSALSVAIQDHSAIAKLGDGGATSPAVFTTYDVVVAAKTYDAPIHSKSSSAVGTSNTTADKPTSYGISAAVAYGDYDHNTEASIAPGAIVDADRIAVNALTDVPVEITWQKWTSPTEVIAHLNGDLGVANTITNGWANATGEAAKLGITGSLSLQSMDNTTLAWVGEGAKLTSNSVSLPADGQDPAGTWRKRVADDWDLLSTGGVSIAARTLSGTIQAAGNISITLQGTGNDTRQGAAMGGSVLNVEHKNTTIAGIDANAVVTTGTSLDVSAKASEFALLVTPSAGRGASISATGMVGRFETDNTTHAVISNTAVVTAPDVTVNADQTIKVVNVAATITLSAQDVAVGAGIALNEIKADTQAFVGNAFAESARATGELGATGSIVGRMTTDALDVLAATDGYIVVAGAAGGRVGSGEPKPTETNLPADGADFGEGVELPSVGLVDTGVNLLKSGINKIAAKVGAAGAKVGEALDTTSSGGGPSFSINAMGAFAYNDTALTTKAFLDHATVDALAAAGAVDTTVTAISAPYLMSGAGAGASMSPAAATASAAIAGSFTLDVSNNRAEAAIRDTTITDAGATDVRALNGGLRGSLALGMAIVSGGGSQSGEGAGGLSMLVNEDSASAVVDDSTITGLAFATGRDVGVQAYNAGYMGAGGGAGYSGGQGGLGLSAAVLSLTDPDGKAATEAAITDSTLSQVDQVTVGAADAAVVVGLAASVGTGSEKFGAQGSAVYADLARTTRATVTGSTITAGGLTVQSAGKRSATLDTQLLRGAPSASSISGYDFDRGGLDDDTPMNADGDALDVGSGEGAMTVLLAGQVGTGKNVVGVSFAGAAIADTHEATVDRSTISLGSGTLNIGASADTIAVGAAVGVSAGGDKFAGAGSVTVLESDLQTTATLGGTGTTTVGANVVNVGATNAGTLAGLSGGFSGGADVAVGASVTAVTAEDRTLATVKDATVQAVGVFDVQAAQRGLYVDLALAGASGNNVGVGGAGTLNLIGNGTRALVSNVSIAQAAAEMSVKAFDDSAIYTAALGVGYGSKAGIGAAAVVNTLTDPDDDGDHVSAIVEGGDIAVGSLLVQADSESEVVAVAVGVGVASNAGLAGSLIVNYRNQDVRALIRGRATVTAQRNVGVLASTRDWMTTAAGAEGVAVQGAGIGLIGVVNVLDGQTEAAVTGVGTKVNALAKSASDTLTVYTGALSDTPDMGDVTSADNFVLDDFALETQELTGLAVNALSKQRTSIVSLGFGAAAEGAGIGANVAVTTSKGDTLAHVDSAAINQTNADAGATQVVDITAADHSYMADLVVSGGFAGLGAGVAGAANANVFARDASAYSDGATIKAVQSADITAESSQRMLGLTAGLGGGFVGGAASVAVTTFDVDTAAYVKGGVVNAGALGVSATNTIGDNLNTGSIAGGVVGGAAAVSVIKSNNDTFAGIGRDSADDGTSVRTDVRAGAVTVAAARTADHHLHTIGGAGGGGALAGMSSVLLLNDTTQAGTYRTRLTGVSDLDAASLSVTAGETVNADVVTGALAAGGSMGLGASVAVVQSSTAVDAVIADESDIRAADVDVTADSAKDYRSILATAGVGGYVGAAASAGVIRVGGGAAQSSNGTDISTAVTNSVTEGGRLNVDGYADSLTEADKAELAASGTYEAPNAAEGYAESAVLAKVAGSRIRGSSLTVDADDTLATEQHVGSLAGGGVGVGAGVGYTGVSTAVTAAIDSASTVDAGAVTVNAATGDLSATKRAGEVYAYVGAGGGFALGAAAAVVQLDSDVTASAAGQLTGADGTQDALLIGAADTTSLNTDTYNGVVAGIAGGLVVSMGQKTGTTTAELAPAGPTRVEGFNRIGIDAITSGKIDVAGVAATGGGLGAATGLYVLGQDDTDTRARLGVATVTAAPGGIAVNALATPDVDVNIIAATLSAGVSAGASVGEAKLTGSVTADTADNVTVDGATPLSVAARMALAADQMSAESKVSVGVGGWLAAVNATVALTENSTQVDASVGDNLNAGSGDLTVIAERVTRQRAETTGVTAGGFVAAGGNVSTTNLGGRIHAVVGNGLHTALDTALGNVEVRAGSGTAGSNAAATTASEYAEAKATSGSGSAVAVAAGQADVTVDTDVYAGFTGSNGEKRIGATGAIAVLADYAVQGESRASTTQAALAGGSGALADRTFDTVVKAEIGDNVRLTGADVLVLARQTNTSSESGTNTGAGGAVNANAGISHTNFNGDAQVRVGDGAGLAALGDSGDLRLLAANTAIGDDTSTMDTGGLIQVPVTEAISTGNLRQTVQIGEAADLLSLDRLSIGTYGVTDVVTNVNVATYGAVSTAVGISKVNLAQANSIAVGDESTITAGGDITLAAGRSGDGFTDSTSGARAYSDVYNWTLVPLTTYATAEATNDSTSALTLGTDTQVTALGDATLSSYGAEGTLVASGRTHNPYLDALSIEEESGQTDNQHTGTITLGGSVVAGAKAKQSVAVDAAGAVTFGADTPTNVARLVTDFVPYDEMQVRIDVLTLQRAQPGLTGDQLASIDASISALQRTQSNMPSHLVGETRVGDAVTALEVGGITAKAGDIAIDANTLSVNGAASLRAVGGAEIRITSATGGYLTTGDLAIPVSHATGGSVTFTGGARSAGLTTLTVTQIDRGLLPRIEIANTSGTGSPYILMGGAVSNYGGTVNVSNDRGDIAMFGTLYARQVNISAPRGNYIYNNADAYYPVGGAPEALWSSARLIQPGSSANDIVGFIASTAFDDGDDSAADLNSDLLYGEAAARIFGTDAEAGTWSGDTWRSARSLLLFNLPNPKLSYPSGYTQYYDSDFKFRTVAAQPTSKTVASADGAIGSGSAIIAETVEINAGYLDINAPVIAGRNNHYGINIDTAAVAAMDEWDRLYAAGTISGGIRDLTPSADSTSLVASKVSLGYNLDTKQIEVGGLEAAGGGAIYLTGRIVSTNPNGSLQVRNGAGKVDILNNSNRTLAVGDINTGQDLRGLIRITDLGRAGNDTPLTTWYIDQPGQALQVLSDAGNPGGGLATATAVANPTTSYKPLEGRRYQWSTDYEVTRTGLVWRDDYASTVNNWVKLDPVEHAGEFVMGASTDAFQTALTTNLSASDFNGVNINIKGDYWNLPVTGEDDNYQMRVAAMVHGSITETSSVRADYPIAIQFNRYGNDGYGIINVHSAGSVTLNGALINPTGLTTINVTQASKTLTQASDSLLDAREVKLFANQIGTAANPFAVVLPILEDHTAGTLTAVARDGIYLDVSGMAGIRKVEAANGDVTINATDGIYRSYTNDLNVPIADGRIVGDAITLSAGRGGIASLIYPLDIVAVDSSARTSGHGVIRADADGDIGLIQASGDFLVDSVVSRLGSINLTATTGSVVSAVRGVRVDAENQARLAQVWDDLGLTDATHAVTATVAPFENMVTAQYADYWQIRDSAAVSDTGTLTLTSDGLDLFRTQAAAKLGVTVATDAQVTAVVQDRYDSILRFVSTTFGDAAPTGTADGTATDFFTKAQNWRYSLDTTSGLYADLTRGAGAWTQAQLENTVASDALRPTPDTQLLLHEVNVSAVGNVDLTASLGSIGSQADSVVITLRPGGLLTTAQKAMLAAAMPGDVTVTKAGNNTLLTVRQRGLLGVEVGGSLRALAGGDVILGGDGDVTIGALNDYGQRSGGVQAGGDVYLAFAGDILSGMDYRPAVFAADTTILESATGSIGSATKGFVVKAAEIISVRAADDVYVEGSSGDLVVGLAYAGDTLSLRNRGSILSSFRTDSQALRLQGGSIVLRSDEGAVGVAGRRMQVGVSGTDGTLSVIGRSFNVYSPTRSLTLDTVSATGGAGVLGTAGDIVVTQGVKSKGYPWVNGGTVIDPSLNVGNLTIQTTGAVQVTGGNLYAEGGDLNVVAGSISVASGSQVSAQSFLGAGGNATLRATSGDITLEGAADANTFYASLLGKVTASGNVTLDGIFRSDAYQIQAGRALQLGDGGLIQGYGSRTAEYGGLTAGQSSLRGATIVFGDEAAARVNFGPLSISAASGFTGGDGVTLSADRLTLTTSSLTLGSDFLAQGGSALGVTVSGDATFDGGAYLQATGGIAFTAHSLDAGDALLASAGGNINLTATRADITIGTGGGMTAGGTLTLKSAGALSIGSGGLASTGNATITAGGAFTFGSDTALRTEISSAAGSVRVNAGSFAIGNAAALNIPAISGATGVSVTATGAIKFANNTRLTSSLGSIAVTAGSALSWGERFGVTGTSVTLRGGSVDGTEGLVATVPGTLAIEATSGDADLRELTLSGGTVRLTAGGTLHLSHGIALTSTLGNLSLTAAAIHFDGLGETILDAKTDLKISATGVIDQRSSRDAAFAELDAGGNVTIKGATVALEGFDIDAHDALQVRATTGRLALQSTQAKAGGATSLIAAGDIDLTGTTLRSAGNVGVQMGNPTAGGVGVGVDLESTGGSLSIVSTNGLALQDDRLVAKGKVALTAANGMSAEGGVIVQAGAGLTARAAFFGSSGVNSFGADGALSLRTTAGALGLAAGTAFNASGGATFTSAGDLTLSGATFDIFGAAAFRAAGDLTVQTAFAPAVHSTLSLAGRDVKLPVNVTVAGPGTSLAVTATRDIAVGDQVSLAADGTMALRAAGDVSLGTRSTLDGTAGLRVTGGTVGLGLQTELRNLVSLTATDLLSLGAYSKLTGDGAISLKAGSIAVDNSMVDLSVVNGGNIDVKAGSGLTVQTTTGGMDFGKELDLDGGSGSLVVNAAGAVTADLFSRFTAAQGVKVYGQTINFGDLVSVRGQSARVSGIGAVELGSGVRVVSDAGETRITGGSITAGSFLDAQANGLVTFTATGDIVLGDHALLNSTDLTVSRDLDLPAFPSSPTAGYGIMIAAGGDVRIGSDSLAASLGKLTVNGTSVTVKGISSLFQGRAEWRAADTVAVKATTGSVRFGTINNDRDLDIRVSGGSIAVQAARDVVLGGFTSLNAGGKVDVTATSGVLSLGEYAGIGAGAGTLKVTVGGLNTSYFASLGSSEGSVNLNISGTALLNYRSSLSGATGVTGRFGALTMHGYATISSGGLIDLSGGMMQLGRIASTLADGLAIRIVSTEQIVGAAGATANIVAPLTGSVLLDATFGIGYDDAPLFYEGVEPSATSSDGAVYIAPASPDEGPAS